MLYQDQNEQVDSSCLSNSNGFRSPDSPTLHHIQEARERQGLSLRCVARRLQITATEAKEQEDGKTDLRLSELYAWQAALEVPLEELVCELDDALSPRVLERARMLKIMKTVQALRAATRTVAQTRLADTLYRQMVDLMPELKSVSPWPTVGQRRTGEEMGRIVENPIPERWIHEAG